MGIKSPQKQKNSVSKPRVVVAMSGGVDSSVAAAILKKAGYEVLGVFMKFWKEPDKRGCADNFCHYENKCCSAEAQADARRVAAKLKIPFYTVDAEKEFKKKVVDYFVKEYAAGRTPNPCVECNHFIKFGLLMDKTKSFGADFLATGHYARLKRASLGSIKLFVARDKLKDQSYFLYALTPDKLKRVIFPIGDYNKSEVRKMAKRMGLAVFKKRDSQEVCFINTDLYGFLGSRIEAKKGPIVTANGKSLGMHNGLAYYTIGQRKGLNIGGTGPYYVVKKNFKNNALVVAGSNKDPLLYQKEMLVKNVNLISPLPKNGRCQVKIRYSTRPVFAKIRQRQKEYLVVFDKPQKAVTSGQAAVFYSKNELLGGGIII